MQQPTWGPNGLTDKELEYMVGEIFGENDDRVRVALNPDVPHPHDAVERTEALGFKLVEPKEVDAARRFGEYVGFGVILEEDGYTELNLFEWDGDLYGTTKPIEEAAEPEGTQTIVEPPMPDMWYVDDFGPPLSKDEQEKLKKWFEVQHQDLPVHTTCFSLALDVLKDGARIARTGWNGLGQYLELQRPDEHSKMRKPYIYISPVDGEFVPWFPSQTDLLADDWYVVQ